MRKSFIIAFMCCSFSLAVQSQPVIFINAGSRASHGSNQELTISFPGTYCHEVLHLCGLYDKYCARIYDPVTDSVRTEGNCDPPPDPDGNCCIPRTDHTRCTVPCTRHEDDIMGASGVGLSCDIMDVLKNAGFDKCPEECCSSNMTFSRPSETYITPGYLHFGDKNTKFGSIGVSVGFTKYLNSSFGVTVDAGYYMHTDKDNSIKERSTLLNITGGIIYLPGNQTKSDLTISTHAMAGISRYSQKTTYNNNSFSANKTSFHFNVGAAVNLKLNQSFTIRILQADYAPTFFYSATQQNFRLSSGLVYSIPDGN